MNVELTSMLWGGLSGAAVFALGLYWFWDMKPHDIDMEWLKSEVKDLRSDVKDLSGECSRLVKRVDTIEHPPFEPKFGDWVSATYRGNTVKAVYLSKLRDGQHRLVANVDGTVEFYADAVEPLDD